MSSDRARRFLPASLPMGIGLLGLLLLAVAPPAAEAGGPGAPGGPARPAQPARPARPAAPPKPPAPARNPERDERRERLRHLDRVAAGAACGSGRDVPTPATPRQVQPPSRPEVRTPRFRAVLRVDAVRFAGDLARVDYRIPVENRSRAVAEWRHRFWIDPRAEVVSAAILDGAEGPVYARTLPAEDARRIYDESRRTPQDPLLMERTRRDRLDLRLWPVPARSTVTLQLSFVTPLRVRNGERIYQDVLRAYGFDEKGKPRAVVKLLEDLLKDPEAVPHMPVPGLPRHPDGGYRARAPITGQDAGRIMPATPFSDALVVRGGGLGKFVGVWSFDPAAYLKARGIERLPGLQVEFLGVSGGASRVAPALHDVETGPTLMTGRFVRGLKKIAVQVRVRDAAGGILHSEKVEVGAERWRGDEDLEAALATWHRAALVHRVFDWAGENKKRRKKAVRFACRIGVLGHGTAGLAIPLRERRRLDPASQKDYFRRNTTLGNVSREGDVFTPPAGSVDR